MARGRGDTESEGRVKAVLRRIDVARETLGYILLAWIAIAWIVASSGAVRIVGVVFLVVWLGLGAFWRSINSIQ